MNSRQQTVAASQSKPAPLADSQTRRRSALIAAGLALLTVAVFWPVTQHDFINYDDDLYVTSNSHVQHGVNWSGVKWAFTAVVAANWHPLTLLSHMLDVELFGLRPWGHHLTSVLLHAVNTVLLFLLLRILTGTLWRSALVAALFALHPLHVESVAWVAERKDVLSGCFGLLALYCYGRYAQGAESRERGGKTSNIQHPTSNIQWSYWLALVFFALGLMSKPMLVTWPFVLLLLDYWPLGRFTIHDSRFTSPRSVWSFIPALRDHSSLLREKRPFFALSAASCVVTVIAQHKGGAVQTFTEFSLGQRLGNVFVSYARYLGKTFWPAELFVPYPHPGHWPGAVLGLSLVLLLGLAVLGLWQARRRPFLLVGGLWFVGTLVPVIGIVQVGGQSLADRYTYLPLIGIFWAVVWWAGEWTAGSRGRQRVAGVVVVLVLGMLTALTTKQIRFWQDSESLFRHALDCSPENETALNNLSGELLDKKQPEQAAALARRLLKLRPENSDGWNNLGLALSELKDSTNAITAYETSLHLKPDVGDVHVNLGNSYIDLGQLEKGVEHLREALKLAPNHPTVHNQLARALVLQNRHDEALEHYRRALQLAPYDWKTYQDMGMVLLTLGRRAEAIANFKTAVRLNPQALEALNNLGGVLLESGQPEAAIGYCREVLRQSPDFARAHDNLGSALASQGKLDEALTHYREAIRLNPAEPKTRFNLGRAFFLKKQFADAVREYTEALRLSPDLAPAKAALADAHFQSGMMLAGQGRQSEAVQQWRAALQVQPDQRESLNALAWTLATSRDDSIRNGGEALTFAEQLARLTDNNSPEALDTLAAAQAANGRFADAIRSAQKALSLADASGHKKLAQDIRSHLEAYQRGDALRE